MGIRIECEEASSIECPNLPCKKMVPIKGVFDHLKNDHGSYICRTEASGEIGNMQYAGLGSHKPVIAQFDGQIFLLKCVMEENRSLFWVTILGTDEKAKRYDVRITAAPQGNMTLTARMKIYSTEMREEDVLKDPCGVMEISKNNADRMIAEREDAKLVVGYHIIHK